MYTLENRSSQAWMLDLRKAPISVLSDWSFRVYDYICQRTLNSEIPCLDFAELKNNTELSPSQIKIVLDLMADADLLLFAQNSKGINCVIPRQMNLDKQAIAEAITRQQSLLFFKG